VPGTRLIDEVFAGLAERGDARRAVQDLVDATSTGRPAVLAIGGVAGIGKTSVLERARRLGDRSGLRTLSARGSDLEQTVAYGVLRDLLAPLDGTGDERLAPVFSDVPALPVLDPDAAHRTHLAAVDLVREAAATGPPILLLVDDAQWADVASVAALAALAARLDDALVGLLIAARPSPAGTPAGPLDRLWTLPVTVREELAPLSVDGTRTLLEGFASGVERWGPACHAVSGGVPFYLTELGAELARHPEATSAEVAALSPVAVRRSVVLRVEGAGAAAVAVARAIGVLGDGAPPRRVAALAGVDPGTAARTADALAAADVLRPGESPGFAHPILAAAVLADTPASVRADLHARAAGLLREDGEPVSRIAAHLLRAPAAGDPAVALELAAAGAEAMGRSATHEAIALLARAVEEPPPAPARADVLLALGTAELLAGRPEATERLAAAAAAADDPAQMAQITGARVTAAALTGRFGDGLALVAEAEAAGLPGPLARRLDGHVAVAACSTVSGIPVAHQALARLAAADDPGPIGRSTMVLDGVVRGGTGAAATVEGARAALRAAEAETGPDAIPAHYPAIYALIVCGAYADAQAGIDALDRLAAASASRIQAAMVAGARAQLAAHRGRVDEAARQGRLAVDLGAEAGFGVGRVVGTAWLGFAELERGDLDAAAAVLAPPFDPPLTDTGAHLYVRFQRGRLAAARGDHAAALAGLLAVGEGLTAWGWTAPVEHLWRGEAARSAEALGDDAAARALCDEEVAAARALGTPLAVGTALAARAEVTSSPADAAEAVSALEGSGADLALARALLVQGRLLVGAADAVGARVPLRRSLDLTAGLGATAVAERARALLVSTGARPRRAARTGVGALTDRERRVAELAATGLSNREIATREICTVKTVEVHLTNAYRKLGVGRAELPEALAGA